MQTYILMSTLTPEGRRTLHSDPDRIDEVNQEIPDFGCQVVAQYAVLGSYPVRVVRSSFRRPGDWQCTSAGARQVGGRQCSNRRRIRDWVTTSLAGNYTDNFPANSWGPRGAAG